jgi:hypothetical protein
MHRHLSSPFSRQITAILVLLSRLLCPACLSLTPLVALAAAILLGWPDTPAGAPWPAHAAGTTRYVALGGVCGGMAPCYSTVQSAVDTSQPGDEIRVATGVYIGVNSRPRHDVTTTGVVTQVVYISKTVTIRGGYTTTNWTTSDPVANPTTLDAQGQGRVLYITGNISPTIAGLRITRGDTIGLGGSPWSGDAGGGVYIITATATLSNNWVFGNTSRWDGGGVYLYSSASTLNGNTITSNTAQVCGGGGYLWSSAVTLSGNTITSNTAREEGGLVLDSCPATLSANIITFNTAQDYCGGVQLYLSPATLINTVVADNRANSAGSGLCVEGSSPRLLHTTIARNTGGDGSGIYFTNEGGNFGTVVLTNTILVSQTVGLSVTAGNAATVNGVLWFGTPITVSQAPTAKVTVQHQRQGNPAFAPDGYHLTAGSAAIDAGVNSGVMTDIDGEPRDAAPDLGADEYMVSSDSYEPDNTCAQANTILPDGSIQTHNFHVPNDEDWVKFQGLANKSYIIRVANVGDNVDAVVMLYSACDQAPLASDHNAFGPTIKMQWTAPSDGLYYLQVMQNDPSVYGDGTNYDLSVAVDTQPLTAPRNVRALAADQSLIVQWRKSPEPDVAGYRVRWGTFSGGPYFEAYDVSRADTTYFQIISLTNGIAYYVVVHAMDSSNNVSPPSAEVGNIPTAGADTTTPILALNRPSANTLYTTTVPALTVGGVCTDTGNNLSRIQVRNITNGINKWNYGLSGGAMPCQVDSIPLDDGDNQIQATVYDAANNSSSASITIRRITGLKGAVVIVGGHSNSSDSQSNINYVTNHAYNIFRSAGFGREDILYLSPGPLDADGDGVSEVISTTTPANVHSALQWAATKVSAGRPFYLYLMDHGDIEYYCADGCTPDDKHITSSDLDAWLDDLEATSGCDQVTVIIEACHSGSFIDKFDDVLKSIAKENRVVIASTGRTNNAYASAQGAYFSDAFFSAVATSQSLKASFDQGKAAVEATPNNQTPWLDDNGDGLFNPADGALAANRYIAGFFGGMLPRITTAVVTVTNGIGTIQASVEQGDEPTRIVWAAVYAPSFHEPTITTLNLGVPLIELTPDPVQDGLYTAHYNAFGEQGTYRVVVYAQDQAGNQALPKPVQTGKAMIYLPVVMKR